MRSVVKETVARKRAKTSTCAFSQNRSLPPIWFVISYSFSKLEFHLSSHVTKKETAILSPEAFFIEYPCSNQRWQFSKSSCTIKNSRRRHPMSQWNTCFRPEHLSSDLQPCWSIIYHQIFCRYYSTRQPLIVPFSLLVLCMHVAWKRRHYFDFRKNSMKP